MGRLGEEVGEGVMGDWQDHKNEHCFTTTTQLLARRWKDDGGMTLESGTKIYLMSRMHKQYWYATAPDPEDTSDMSDWFTLTDVQQRDYCKPEGQIKENWRQVYQMYQVDDGRYVELLKAVGLSPVCFKCSHFIPGDPRKEYRCEVIGSCIAVTLSDEMKAYLLDKTKETNHA